MASGGILPDFQGTPCMTIGLPTCPLHNVSIVSAMRIICAN